MNRKQGQFLVSLRDKANETDPDQIEEKPPLKDGEIDSLTSPEDLGSFSQNTANIT